MIHNVCEEGRASKRSFRGFGQPVGSCAISVLRRMTNETEVSSLYHEKANRVRWFEGEEGRNVLDQLDMGLDSNYLRNLVICGNVLAVTTLVLQEWL